MNKMKTGYVPALGPEMPMFDNAKLILNDKEYLIQPVNKKKSLMKCETILISAYHALQAQKNKKFTNFREYYDIDDDVFIIGDSGGFTLLMNPKIKIEPEEIMKWQEENCQLAISLDVPPYNNIDPNKPIFIHDDFFIKMQKSYDNVKRMLTVKKTNIPFYICIHGPNTKYLDIWWDKMSEFECDGYALSPKKKSDIWMLANILLWIYEKGIRKNLHFLAMTGAKMMLLLTYFSKYIKNITYDSSRHTQGGISRNFFLKYSLKNLILNSGENMEIDNNFCHCSICSKIAINDYYKNKISGNYLSLHNLNMFLQTDKFYYSLLKNEQQFIDFSKQVYKQLPLIYEYIEYGIKNGRLEANKKYKHHYNFDRPEINQKSLFSF